MRKDIFSSLEELEVFYRLEDMMDTAYCEGLDDHFDLFTEELYQMEKIR